MIAARSLLICHSTNCMFSSHSDAARVRFRLISRPSAPMKSSVQTSSAPARQFVRTFLLLFLLPIAFFPWPLHAQSTNYPNRPLHVIVPFPPGGGIDIAVRVIGHELEEALGQSIVVDNRGGAGGVIGTNDGAKSSPDGYTLTAGTPGPISISPAISAKLPYNPLTDLRTDFDARDRCQHSGGQPIVTGKIGDGPDRSGEEKPERPGFRIERCGHVAASFGRAAKTAGQRQFRACPLQRNGRGSSGPYRRPS